MSEERTQGFDLSAMSRRLEELIAHARFAAALDVIAEFTARGPVAAELDHPLTLARCALLTDAGRKSLSDRAGSSSSTRRARG
jgi:hypothetical protein